MNDLSQLVAQLVQFLAPFLPYLIKAGEKASEEAGKKLGADAWERAKTLWGKLRPKVETKPAAQEAVKDVATAPQDTDAQAALRLQLKKLLAEDETLATEVNRLWEEAKAAGVTVIASGARSVAIGRDASGNVIITGNHNAAPTQPQQSSRPPLIELESSMIHAVRYDEANRLLEVHFNSGRVYCYENVPPDVFQGLLAADSKGQYMQAYIIDVYPYQRRPCRKRLPGGQE